MARPTSRVVLPALGILTVVVALSAMAGPLDPPAGPVAPTFKTLAEVEPRIVLSAANTPGDANSVYSITQPGSYYLTSNLVGVAGKHGIEVLTGGVTIDLMGHTLAGVPGSLQGISASFAQPGLIIRNGTVSGWGDEGVFLSPFAGTTVQGVVLENIVSSANAGSGFQVHRAAVIRACVAHQNAGDGFDLTGAVAIADCQAHFNGGTGLDLGTGGSATNCNASNNGVDGIKVGLGSSAVACAATDNGNLGINAIADASVINCTTRVNGAGGVTAGNNCVVRGHTSSFDAQAVANGAGIRVTGDHCRIESNHCTNSDFGIRVEGDHSRIDGNSCNDNDTGFSITGVNNIVIRNTASASAGANYSVTAGNSVAPRIGVVASDGWGGITNANHPWANFGY